MNSLFCFCEINEPKIRNLQWSIVLGHLECGLYFCKRILCSLGGVGLIVSLEYFPNGEMNLNEGRSWLASSRKYLRLFAFCIELTKYGSYIGSFDVIFSIEGKLKECFRLGFQKKKNPRSFPVLVSSAMTRELTQ